MSGESDPTPTLQAERAAAREELERALSENREKTAALLDSAKEKSESFQTELWRGLLAINGAGLAAAATILAVDGFPPVFIKASAILFFLGLISAAYSWGLGLGFGYWSSHLTVRAQGVVEATADWAQEPRDRLSPQAFERQIRRGMKHRRRIETSTRDMKILAGMHLAVPAVGLSSAAFFAVGASVLIIGLVLFQSPASDAVTLQFFFPQ